MGKGEVENILFSSVQPWLNGWTSCLETVWLRAAHAVSVACPWLSLYKSYAVYFQSASRLYPFTVLKKTLSLGESLLCFLRVPFVAGETDGEAGRCYSGLGVWSWVLHLAVTGMLSETTLSWGRRSRLCSEVIHPSAQATNPSLVILADRKEWRMKTIGLGQEWRSSCWNLKRREQEKF